MAVAEIVAGPGTGLAGVQLPVKLPLVRVNFITDVPLPRKLKRLPEIPDAAVVEIVLLDIVRSVSVHELLVISLCNSQLFWLVQLVILVVRNQPLGVPGNS